VSLWLNLSFIRVNSRPFAVEMGFQATESACA
jgi:hypothetical protein